MMTPQDEIIRIVSAQMKHVADEVAKIVAERIEEHETEQSYRLTQEKIQLDDHRMRQQDAEETEAVRMDSEKMRTLEKMQAL